MKNNEKILSVLQQINQEIPRQDLADLTGISPKNISRYLNMLESEGLIKTFVIQTGKVGVRKVELTEKGKNFPIKQHLQVGEIIPEVVKEPEPIKKGKGFIKATCIKCNEIFNQQENRDLPVCFNCYRDLSPEQKKAFKKTRDIRKGKAKEPTPTPKPEPTPTPKPSKEKELIKFELRTMISTLPVRKVDYSLFGFKTGAEFKAKVNQLIDKL